ncbi:protein of unknown function [Mesotoga infera]|uniref:Uncharacterized protein n=1 Tax=Mesotoga infera TaxID=1236046 RepID=A0A7Z7PNC1_9BACT|nr:protein of unknown function [Mesotoga infera]
MFTFTNRSLPEITRAKRAVRRPAPERGPVLGDLRLEVRGGRCEEREDLDLLTSDLIPFTSV